MMTIIVLCDNLYKYYRTVNVIFLYICIVYRMYVYMYISIALSYVCMYGMCINYGSGEVYSLNDALIVMSRVVNVINQP